MTRNISYLSEYEPYDGGYVSFGHEGGKITSKGIIKTGKLEFENVYFVKELKTPRQHNMYFIDLNNIVPHKNLTCLVAKASVDESMLWHRRLGHLNFKTMNKLVRNNLVKGLPSKCFENNHTCVACLKGKQHKVSYKTKLVNSISKPLHTFHMDLFGPTSVSSLNYKWYCLVVTDDFSRFTWIFFLRTKDESSSILRNFITEIENLKDLKVKIIRCDNRGEFKNQEMNEFCTKKGIRKEFCNARIPHQNGLAKRRNRTLIEAARTMLADAKLPVTFWAEAVNTAYHLGKFDAKGDEGYFVGTSSTNILDTKDVPSQAVKKDVSSLRYIALLNWFHEAHMEISNDTIRNSDAQDDSQKEQDCNADVPESSGISNPAATSKVPSANQVEPAVSLTVESDILTVSSPVPTVCLDISPECSSGSRLISKGVFSQTEAPSLGNALTLSSRFKDTIGDTTNAVTLNEIEADLSNMESSLPVSPTPTFRIYKDHPKSQIISLVDTPIQTRHKSKDMEEQSFIATIHQKTNPELLQFCLFSCFLSQEERKKIFDALKDPSWVEAMQEKLLQFKIQNPPGFQDPKFPERVYKVEKAMYGLHQAPRAWYGTLSKYLLDNGFQRGTIDQTLFIRKHKGEFLLVQLDQEILEASPTILDVYISTPDIMFDVCACARHQVTPKECHLHAVKRIFRYLKGDPKLGLWYLKESPFDLVAYSDSDYGGTTQDKKSTTRGCQFLGRRTVPLFASMIVTQGEGSTNPTEPHHTASPQEHHSPQHASPPLSHQPIIPEPIHHDLQAPTKTLTLRRLTKRAIRITQSKALSPNADEHAYLLRNDSQGEAFLTVSSLDAGQDRESIAKTSAMPYESSPRVPSLDTAEGSMQQRLHELMKLCTSLQRQQY
nr:hypothetical protein [Tanacetum cinerariifolium]